MGSDSSPDVPAPGGYALLLRDTRWPQLPGVCCWRRAICEPLRVAGVRVMDVDVTPKPLVEEPVAGGGRSAPRMGWLPNPVRKPLVLVYRGARHLARTLSQWISVLGPTQARARRARASLRSRAGSAILVIAESLDAADAALAAGVAANRLWALALPAERLWPGAMTPYGEQVARLGSVLGGLLVDSEPARESIERVVASGRPRVEIFPPVASDRTCGCVAAAGAEPGVSMPAEVSQIVLWRRMLDDDRAEAVPYTYPAARLRGLSAPWTPASFRDWNQVSAEHPRSSPPGVPAADAVAAVQNRAVRAMLASVPQPPIRGGRHRDVVVSGFDLKFVTELAERLNIRADLKLTLDEWPTLGTRSPRTERLVSSADTVLAEWARPSAVWLSRHKRPGQLLIVRLHRYELDRSYPRDIDIDQVDAVVYVSPPMRRRILEELGWPAEKLVYIPNFLDTDWLDRPKLSQARFGLGFVGMDFANKRFDLVLDVLAEVRRQDPRFHLFVRSVMPWDNIYAWASHEEREYIGWCLERIEHDPLLRGAITFDAPGRDMARWYRRVGHVLSMSDIESFHLAAAEGMASGAVPVIRPWPGADEIYGKEWIHGSVDEAAAAVLASSDLAVWRERGAQAQAEIRRSADPVRTLQAWADLMHGDLAAARAQFAGFVVR